MSMNLYCNGKYEVPIQIPIYPSYMIYSNNDGGPLGVIYRLEQYFRMIYQESFNNCNKLPEHKREHERKFWKEWLEDNLEELSEARLIASENPEDIRFGVM